MQLDSIQDVFADQLGDLRSAETQLTQALPKMANAALDPDLKQAFSEHLDQTRGHLERIDEIVRMVDVAVPEETCEGMQGLIKEGEQVIQSGGAAPPRTWR